MSDFLARACAASRERVAASRAALDLPGLLEAALARPPGPSLAAALARPGTAVIAEIKRASPSRGRLSDIADPGALAQAYAAGGAAAVSVLTEPQWFAGGLDDLRTVSRAVTVPTLRKDFLVDAYQVWEARRAGAAAVLLIVAALPPPDLEALMRAVDEAGLDALVEVHAAEEAEAAVVAHQRSGSQRRLVLGVNARNLSTLAVDPGQFARVRGAIAAVGGMAPDALLVAESGVGGPQDVARLAAEGAAAVLVGEHVATAADPRAAVAALVAAGAEVAVPSRSPVPTRPMP